MKDFKGELTYPTWDFLHNNKNYPCFLTLMHYEKLKIKILSIKSLYEPKLLTTQTSQKIKSENNRTYCPDYTLFTASILAARVISEFSNPY